MNYLELLVLTLLTTIFINLVLKKFYISTIVGYLLTGIAISFYLDMVHINSNIVSHIAEFGIVFLMFTIGLEFSIRHLKSMKKEVFVFGFLQVGLSALLFTSISYYFFNINLKSSIVIALALSLSSTAIVLKVFNESGDIRRPYGRYSLGILLFQDLAVIPILIMIDIFANPINSLSSLLFDTFISGVVVLSILFVLGKYATEKFFAMVVDSKSEELFMASVLLIVLSSALLAHLFNFSYSLGAFVAGMLISETKYKHQIEADLVPFRDLLLGLFFISVGMQLNFNIVIDNFFTIIILTATILLLKAVIIFIIIVSFSFRKRAMKTALALAQVGEFSFAVFALANSYKLIDNDTLQILIAVVIISLIFTSLVIRYVREFTNLFFHESSEIMSEPIKSSTLSHHIIVCGYSKLGQSVVNELKNKGLNYIAIETDRVHMQKAKDLRDNVILGNASSKYILNSVNIKNAMAVIIAIDNDDKLRLIAQSIHAIDSNIAIIVKISQNEQLQELKDLDIHGFVNENKSVSTLLVEKAMKCEI